VAPMPAAATAKRARVDAKRSIPCRFLHAEGNERVSVVQLTMAVYTEVLSSWTEVTVNAVNRTTTDAEQRISAVPRIGPIA